MRINIPSFRLPASVLDDEVGYHPRHGRRHSLQLAGHEHARAARPRRCDAVFVGSGAPTGKNLDIPGRAEATANIHIGIEWLASAHFGHIERIGERVLIIGVGNTRDGLLPHVAPPRRHGRQGHRPPVAHVLQGVAVGARGRRRGRRRDRREPRAEALRARERTGSSGSSSSGCAGSRRTGNRRAK